MKILVVCKGEYRHFFPLIAQALARKYGCEVHAMSFSSPATRMLGKRRAFGQIHDLAAYLRQEVPRLSLVESLAVLREVELTSGPETISMMVHADRIVRRYPFETIIRVLAAVVGFWKGLFSVCRPDAVIGEVASASEWLAWSLAKRMDIPYLIPYPTPAANRFFFIREPAGRWERMECLFEEVCERGLSSEDSRTAEDFVWNFRARKFKPPFLDWDLRSLWVPNLWRLTQRISRVPFRVQSWIEDGLFEVGSYHGTPPWESVWQEILRLCRHGLAETTIFRKTAEKGSNVYFPLHVQPEFTTDVRAPFFTNQIALIESVSKSLPVGCTLLVKEHPGMKGWRSLHYYRALKKLYNVQLLSPSVDSHDLIQHADVVLTITGSSAWEAILYEKPVIAFGPLCYGFRDMIYRCSNVSDLPALLSEAINRFQADHDRLLKFVWALLGSAYELEWADPVRMPRVLEPHNIENVADAIVEEVKSRNSELSPAPLLN
jgi:hypothetical protein